MPIANRPRCRIGVDLGYSAPMDRYHEGWSDRAHGAQGAQDSSQVKKGRSTLRGTAPETRPLSVHSSMVIVVAHYE